MKIFSTLKEAQEAAVEAEFVEIRRIPVPPEGEEWHAYETLDEVPVA